LTSRHAECFNSALLGMIIADAGLRAREAAGNPIRVAMIGAGLMASAVPGMRLCATASRRGADTERA
jgi:predicted homoserine dehydrogenase-like protein